MPKRIADDAGLEDLTKAELLALVKRLLRERRPPKPDATDWTKMKRTCPRCGRTGKVATDFGTKTGRRGNVTAQSWCRRCRAQTNYHARPRTYSKES